MTMVVDASVTMAWCFADEATPETYALLDRLAHDEAVVPGLWPFEVANTLLVAERRGRVTEAQAARFLDLLGELPIDVEPSPADITALVAAGRHHGLSAYDAGYLVLAESRAVPLATLDTRLAAAARNAGVELLAGT